MCYTSHSDSRYTVQLDWYSAGGVDCDDAGVDWYSADGVDWVDPGVDCDKGGVTMILTFEHTT